MGHQRRFFPSKTPYFITNRTAEGLPFVANDYINSMLFGILARASKKYPGITICAFMVLANHYHLLVVLDTDPNVLNRFMNYVDGEVAKLVVRWLGKRHYKVWGQRYCAAALLDSEAAFKEMLYTFANPIEAGLCATADKWTGCSTVYALHDPIPRKYKWVKPSLAPQLPNGPFKKRMQKALLKEIAELDAPSYTLDIQPFAWMECFPDTRHKSTLAMQNRLFESLARVERRCEQERRAEKRTVADPIQLAEQNPHRYYKPKKYSRRVFCISTIPEIRIGFIRLYNDLCAKAKDSWLQFLEDLSPPFIPHGMFLPPMPAKGSVLSRSIT